MLGALREKSPRVALKTNLNVFKSPFELIEFIINQQSSLVSHPSWLIIRSTKQALVCQLTSLLPPLLALPTFQGHKIDFPRTKPY